VQEELYGLEGRPPEAAWQAAAGREAAHEGCQFGTQWIFLKFDQPVTAPAVRRLTRGHGYCSSYCFARAGCLHAPQHVRNGATAELHVRLEPTMWLCNSTDALQPLLQWQWPVCELLRLSAASTGLQ
jgi:hypothetical protein